MPAPRTSGLFHDTLTTDLSTRPPDDGPTVRDGHEAILTALKHDDLADAAITAYRSTRLAEHLWALDQHGEALAAVYDSLGHRPADNAAMLQPWVERAAGVLGPDHPHTLNSRNNLASTYASAGRLGEGVSDERWAGPGVPTGWRG